METVIVSKAEYENMKETIEILSNANLVKDIREGIEDIRRGRFVSLDSYLKK